MRKNIYGELMRINKIELISVDVMNPTGDWVVVINWSSVHEKSNKLYDNIVERISVSEAISLGYMSMEGFMSVYTPLSVLSDKLGSV